MIQDVENNKLQFQLSNMTQNQKMLLGLAVLVVGGYMLWQKSQKPKSFANVIAAPDEGDDNIILGEECQNDRGTGNSRRVQGVGIFGSRKVYQCCGNRRKYVFNKPSMNCSESAVNA